MTPTWEVIVIGAGPAGAMAARELARRGARVLMVDRRRFPRDKVCGACLNGRALALLDHAGLGGLADSLGAVPLVEFRLSAAGRHVSLSLPGGAALSRARFDAALVGAAVEAGAAFLPETCAVLAEAGDAERRVLLRPVRHAPDAASEQPRDEVASARVVIVAGGLGTSALAGTREVLSTPSRGAWIGVGGTARLCPAWCGRGTIHMAVGRGGYVGLVRQEDDSLNVAAAFDSAFVKAHGPAGAVEAVLKEAGMGLEPAERDGRAGCRPRPGAAVATLPSVWHGTVPLTRRTRPVAAHRVFVIGDAAGYVEPFTGEGIAWALASGAGVAPYALLGSREWTPDLPQKWTAAYRNLVAHRQQWCRIVAAVLHRPRLVRAGMRAIQALPGLVQRIVGRIHKT